MLFISSNTLFHREWQKKEISWVFHLKQEKWYKNLNFRKDSNVDRVEIESWLLLPKRDAETVGR